MGRNDGKEKGEYSPIFWDNSRWEMVDWRVRWLSTSPDSPGSKGWDAVSLTFFLSFFPYRYGSCRQAPILMPPQSQTRIVTLATLKHRATSDLLHVGNTHYDDKGTTARAESSLLIRQMMREWVSSMVKKSGVDASKADKAAVVLLGDFSEFFFSGRCVSD